MKTFILSIFSLLLGAVIGAISLFYLEFSQRNIVEIWELKETIFLENGSRINKGSILIKNPSTRCELNTGTAGITNLGLLISITPEIYEKFRQDTQADPPYIKIQSNNANSLGR